MKLRDRFLASVSLAWILMLGSLFSVQAEGSRGGGQSINHGGRPVFRDLIDQTVCDWKTGPDFIRLFLPSYPQFLKKLEQTHWYFADAFRREANQMQICLTRSKLKEIPAEDLDSVAIFKQKTNQVAIRFLDNHQVYIAYHQMMKLQDERSRLALFSHEVNHSFLPIVSPKRNESLRSLNKKLFEDYDSNSLEVSLRANGFNLPHSMNIPGFEEVRKHLLLALDEEANIVERMEAAKKTRLVWNWLWTKDQRTLKEGLKTKFLALLKSLGIAIKTGNVASTLSLYQLLHLQVNDPIEYDSFEEKFVTEKFRTGIDGVRVAVIAGQLEVLKALAAMPGLKSWRLGIAMREAIDLYKKNPDLSLKMLEILSCQPEVKKALRLGVTDPASQVAIALSSSQLTHQNAVEISRLICANVELGAYSCWKKVYGGNVVLPLSQFTAFFSLPGSSCKR